MRLSQKIPAFTLVEVVLALAIAVFVLTAILSLFPVAIGSSKASSDDTVISAMTVALVDDMRRQYFVNNGPRNPPADNSPKHKSGDTNVLPGTDDVQAGTTPPKVTTPQVFFDVSGMRLKYPSGANAGKDMTRTDALSAGAIYQCSETLQGDPNTLSATGSDGSTSTQAVNLLDITLKFEWPTQAATPPNSKIIHASVARY